MVLRLGTLGPHIIQSAAPTALDLNSFKNSTCQQFAARTTSHFLHIGIFDNDPTCTGGGVLVDAVLLHGGGGWARCSRIKSTRPVFFNNGLPWGQTGRVGFHTRKRQSMFASRCQMCDTAANAGSPATLWEIPEISAQQS